MSISFPAGGSLYHSQDLEKVTGRPGVQLEDEGFWAVQMQDCPCGVGEDHSSACTGTISESPGSKGT